MEFPDLLTSGCHLLFTRKLVVLSFGFEVLHVHVDFIFNLLMPNSERIEGRVEVWVIKQNGQLLLSRHCSRRAHLVFESFDSANRIQVFVSILVFKA